MREQLIQYVELLFAGAKECEDIKQEILQNTLDRYDDLIDEGKVPEAAYRLAITGIGDINEILGTKPQSATVYHSPTPTAEPVDNDNPTKKLLRAIAVGLYILCPLPAILLSEMFGWDTLGVCGTLAIVAVATMLIILGSKKSPKDMEEERREKAEESLKSPLATSISSLVWAIGLALYFLISFTTNAWYVTWVIFPILGAVDKLLNALIAKIETGEYEIAFSGSRKLRKSVGSMIWAIGLALYFIISFATMAWYITWLIFPIIGAVRGLVNAILDLKEAVENET